MNVCDEASLAVEPMKGKRLLFMVIKSFCTSSLLFFKSFLITNQFAFQISFFTDQESQLLVLHSDPKIRLLTEFKPCFSTSVCLSLGIPMPVKFGTRADFLCIFHPQCNCHLFPISDLEVAILGLCHIAV